MTAIIITAIISFYLGYQFCMMRNVVKKTQKLLKLVTALMESSRPTEEIIKELKELEI